MHHPSPFTLARAHERAHHDGLHHPRIADLDWANEEEDEE